MRFTKRMKKDCQNFPGFLSFPSFSVFPRFPRFPSFRVSRAFPRFPRFPEFRFPRFPSFPGFLSQKGQMALFVALVFQVLFVLFSMVVNVGLLIHHKINLQNSVDLAAYYGAQKQAEMLNALAHINYQIRQSWKLLSWRVRVAGSAGYYTEGDPKIGYGTYTDALNDMKNYMSQALSNPMPPFTCVAHRRGWHWERAANIR